MFHYSNRPNPAEEIGFPEFYESNLAEARFNSLLFKIMTLSKRAVGSHRNTYSTETAHDKALASSELPRAAVQTVP